jgi:transcriptional regulator
VYDKMQRAIVPIRLHVESVEGTWKLGQNKPPPARMAAASKLKKSFGQELRVLSALMRRPDLD